MRKLLLFTTVIALIFGLSACSEPFLSRLGNSDRNMADERLDRIITALENGDSEALKEMFSQKALAEATDLVDGIEYAIQFYSGKLISTDGALDVIEQINGKEKKKNISAFYTVETDEDTFIVFFIDHTDNTTNPEEVGLYMLQIIKESDREEHFDWGGEKTYCAGVYRPKATQ